MKVAFVMPWYGRDIPGGAEAEARRTVAHLQKAGVDVEVLTTCIRDFHADWARNAHRPGVSIENEVRVRRFAVEKRDRDAFDAINAKLMAGRGVSIAEEQTYINEMIRSPSLYEYIAQHRASYIYFFIPYMFATTYFGGQVAPERSVIIPCLHDESYAYMDIYQRVLPQARALLLHTEAEYKLAEKIYGPSRPGHSYLLVGEGIETNFTADGRAFREKYDLNAPFLLVVGRRSPGKNTPLLLEYWRQYVQMHGESVKLVLVGAGDVHIPTELRRSVIDLGFVSMQDKYDAYAAADVFCMPSVNESFSIVTMESWVTETPVLVHGDCAVTVEHCHRSQGGLYFKNADEFAATLNYLLARPQLARQMGRNGRRYVHENYRWDIIIDRYLTLISQLTTELEGVPLV